MDSGSLVGSFTLPAPLDGLGIRIDPTNASRADIFINIEATDAARVIKLVVERSSFTVLSGQTLFASYVGSRLCSGTLATSGLSFGALGTSASIWFAGEEDRDPYNRAMAFAVDSGEFIPLVKAGRRKWEQVAPCPVAQALTLLILTDDTSPLGYVAMYLGTKTSIGTEFEKAGLTNGLTYGLFVENWTEGDQDPQNGTRFAFTSALNFDATTTTAQTGAALQSANATLFARPEDAHWLRDGSSLFWIASGSAAGPCRLFRLTFDDISNPLAGGVVSVLAKQSSIPYYDNLAIDATQEFVIAQTDGPSPSVIDSFRISNGQKVRLGSMPLPFSGEYTGVIDASAVFGERWFLSATQASPGQLFAFQLNVCNPNPCANGALSGGTCPNPIATLGVPYAGIVSPVGGVPHFLFENVSPFLPRNTGMTLDRATGAITGTPIGTVPSTQIGFKITDAQGQTAFFTCPMAVSSASLAFLASLVIIVLAFLFAI